MEKQKTGEDKKKKNKRKMLLISAAIAVAAVIVIISAMIALRSRDTLELTEPMYTFVNGMRIDLPAGIKLVRHDNITYVKNGDTEQRLDRFPLINAEDGSIILQRSCSLSPLVQDVMYRLDYFTKVGKDERGIVISYKKKERWDVSGFIYDNSDTYIFLEPVTLSWGETTMELQPMTIVQAGYMEYIHIFGPDIEEAVFEGVDTDRIEVLFRDGKRLNVAADRLYMENGAWQLIFMPMEGLLEWKTGGAEGEEE